MATDSGGKTWTSSLSLKSPKILESTTVAIMMAAEVKIEVCLCVKRERIDLTTLYMLPYPPCR